MDGEFLYWISTAKDSTWIYQASKSSGAILLQVKARRSERILAYSSVLQPFPGNKVSVLISLFAHFGSEKSQNVSFSRNFLQLLYCALSVASKCQGLVCAVIAICPGLQFISMSNTAWAVVHSFRHGKPLSCHSFHLFSFSPQS